MQSRAAGTVSCAYIRRKFDSKPQNSNQRDFLQHSLKEMLLHLGQRLADSNGTGRVKFFTQRQSLHRHRIERSFRPLEVVKLF